VQRACWPQGHLQNGYTMNRSGARTSVWYEQTPCVHDPRRKGIPAKIKLENSGRILPFTNPSLRKI